ncbi:DUF952 domain-containing protein [Gloeothece verrucosa]|uniref:Glutathione S-transferase domain protein n=1 Tax=Gloeothece verrucosa (strain PCC 7822) TaxID=497965 RepID=E0UE22_GLOV7|nr:DUF952 domain-containing protein [Gloeothece verrucosa]ADN13026.1 protein of unknown function DUF952 [Gloeothece verrucosa PCC 7822]
MIFHITSQNHWQKAVELGEYRADSLETEGFIHCSTRQQLIKVANAFYRGQADLVVLCIDPEKLKATVKWEPPAHLSSEEPVEINGLGCGTSSALFPHVYGAINLEAVVSQLRLIPEEEGLFSDSRI